MKDTWLVEKYIHDGDQGMEYVVTCGPVLIAAEISNKTRAQLLAAAPELLEALRSLVDFTGAYAGGENMDTTDYKFNRDALWDQACAAIAKAEGRDEK